MRSILFAAGIALAAAAPAAAQSTFDLRLSLWMVPATIFASGEAELARFVSIAEAAKLGDEVDMLQRLEFGAELRPIASLRYGPAQWSAGAGVDLADVQFFVGYGRPPGTVAIWGFSSDTEAAALLDSLRDRGFAPVRGFENVLANGAPNAVNLAARDPANPWLGPMGQTSAVAPFGIALVQSADPALTAKGIDFWADQSVAEAAPVRVMLDGVEASLTGQVLQALLVSPRFGLIAAQPDLGTATTVDGARQQVEAAVEAAAQGVPPYLMGLLLDVQVGEQPGLVVALAYPDCDTAEMANAILAERWRGGLNPDVAATVSASTWDGGDGVCAAVTRIVADEAGTVNPVGRKVYGEIVRRGFSLLQIAIPPGDAPTPDTGLGRSS